MKKYVLAVLFSVFLLIGNLFAITGEIIVRSINGTQPKLRITVNTPSYAWKWNGTTQQVIPETRTFPVVHEGYSYNFDAPKSIDSNTDYLPWGLMNFTISTLDANNNVVTTINFTLHSSLSNGRIDEKISNFVPKRKSLSVQTNR